MCSQIREKNDQKYKLELFYEIYFHLVRVQKGPSRLGYVYNNNNWIKMQLNLAFLFYFWFRFYICFNSTEKLDLFIMPMGNIRNNQKKNIRRINDNSVLHILLLYNIIPYVRYVPRY